MLSRRPHSFTIKAITLALLICLSLVGAGEDLYKILGVSKTATEKEIKKAYRKKALDTHPDKNKDADQEKAAEEFRKVVHAFEVLSDKKSRQYYDRTGRTDGGSNTMGGGGFQGGGFHFQWNFHRRPVRLKDNFRVQQAQSRVLHVVSLSQLETIMLDDNGLLERNLLICVVKPGRVQTHAEDEMVFPYPFAGMSAQNIWWEDILQTIQIRYHRSSELSRLFGAPDADDLHVPLFLFGKRGTPLSNEFSRLSTANRRQFETWVWAQIEVQVHFVNEYPEPVEVFWIHGNRAQLKMTLNPGQKEVHTTMLTHEWWVRDARVAPQNRHRLTPDTCLASWKIVNDTSPQVLIIKPKEDPSSREHNEL